MTSRWSILASAERLNRLMRASPTLPSLCAVVTKSLNQFAEDRPGRKTVGVVTQIIPL